MNPRTLRLDELVRLGLGDEIVRRIGSGEACLAATEEDTLQEAFDAGAEQEALTKREDIVSDIVDLLSGEVWLEGMTDDQRAFLTEDLCTFVGGNSEV